MVAELEAVPYAGETVTLRAHQARNGLERIQSGSLEASLYDRALTILFTEESSTRGLTGRSSPGLVFRLSSP